MTAGTPIVVDNLHKRFDRLEVLKGISLRAEQGDVISIIGSSGSGKSTFLRCINLLERYDSGSIRIYGEALKVGPKGRIDNRQADRIRQRVGMVFQSFNLWSHLTILENLIEGPVHVLGMKRSQAIDKAEALLDKVGIHDKRAHYPGHLSGGQQQRAAIARALAMDPDVLLFDEPTSALDPELVGEVLRVMRGLAEERRTMIIVTHEMRFARDVSSKVVFLHHGRVEEEGSPEQVFGDPRSERCRQFVSQAFAAA
ncbi:ABC transporter ATP-binding protein [Aquamicrobium ahrensii]|uniref:ABC-type histidine transport system ATPase subunit n=1 Tax=Aquamicrobium ahrensii TaxID=469551 RepID=A0ABV2KJU4_9HYPH